MNTSDFIKAFAKQYNVSAQAADTWVRSIFEYLGEQCVQNEEIKIAGFGVFKQTYSPARKYVDFKTGNTLVSEPRMNLDFYVGPKMDRAMRTVPAPKEPPQRRGRKSELPIRVDADPEPQGGESDGP